MSEKKDAVITVEANIPSDFAGQVAVEASKRNISIADFIGAAAVAAFFGVTHPFAELIFGTRRDKSGPESSDGADL